jgi:hypothetical protein
MPISVAFKEAYHAGLEHGGRTPQIRENRERNKFGCANHKERINTGKCGGKNALCPSCWHWCIKPEGNKLLHIIGSWINVVKWNLSRTYCRLLHETKSQRLALWPCSAASKLLFKRGPFQAEHTSPPGALVYRSLPRMSQSQMMKCFAQTYALWLSWK